MIVRELISEVYLIHFSSVKILFGRGIPEARDGRRESNGNGNRMMEANEV